MGNALYENSTEVWMIQISSYCENYSSTDIKSQDMTERREAEREREGTPRGDQGETVSPLV